MATQREQDNRESTSNTGDVRGKPENGISKKGRTRTRISRYILNPTFLQACASLGGSGRLLTSNCAGVLLEQVGSHGSTPRSHREVHADLTGSFLPRKTTPRRVCTWSPRSSSIHLKIADSCRESHHQRTWRNNCPEARSGNAQERPPPWCR